MQEIEVNNELGLKVFINGIPDTKLILEDNVSGFLEALEITIFNNLNIVLNSHKLDV